jgi:endonuclease YncB( thermonuclease family)
LGAQAETFAAKVIAVLDGDTVLILRQGDGAAAKGRTTKVRLANIDAPEKGQDFGKRSRASLLEMLGKRQVQIDSQAVDQYGRIVGLISVDGRNVNQEQVRRGMAWEYSHYHSDKAYLALQGDAQQARRGLWAQDSPQPPWQWRKLHPSVRPARPEHAPAVERDVPVMHYDLQCGNKRHCSQMTSCDEALFYLMRCGVKTLDRNRDGSPCESLCEGKAAGTTVRAQPAQPNEGSLE